MGCDLCVLFPNNRGSAFGALAELAALTPPYEAGLIAASARREGFAVTLLDAEALGLSDAEAAATVARQAPRLVVITTDQVNTGDVTKMAAAGRTAHAIRRAAPRVPIALAGIVPTAYPRRVLEEEGADLVLAGEPFRPALELLRKGVEAEVPGVLRLAPGGALEGHAAPMEEAVDELPLPAWDLMPPARYRAHHWHCFDRLDARSPYAAILTGWGCPHRCSYCSVNVVAGRPNYREHSVDQVLGHLTVLRQAHGVRNVRLLDNVFAVRRARTLELCDRIAAAGLDLNLWAYARVESIRDPELLHAMRRAGVRWLAYGFEAASEKVQEAVGKRTEESAIERVVEWTRAAGIHVVGNFIFGLPEEDHASMERTLALARRLEVEWANFYCATAYPGTRLHDEARAQGIELSRDWTAYGQYAADFRPLPTRTLAPREIVAFRDHAFRTYYESERYQQMIARRFGEEARAFVRRILATPIPRRPPASVETRSEA